MVSISNGTAQQAIATVATEIPCSTLVHPHILITGATGFIGSHLVDACVQRGFPVRVLARNAVKARTLPREVRRHYASLSDTNGLKGVAERIDIVFHLGAAMSGDWSAHQRVTVEGTRALLEECHRAGVKRFIYVSSLSAHEMDHLKDGDTIDAAAPLADADTQLGNYARGKAQTEQLVREFCTENGMAYTIVRPGLVYGPGHVIFEHLGSRKGNTFIGVGRRDQRLPMVSIDSVIDALLRIAQASDTNQRVYLVVDEDVPRDQYIKALAAVHGRDYRQFNMPLATMKAAAFVFQTARRIVPLRKIPDATVAKVRSRGLSLRYDTTSLRRDTGWQPKQSLHDGLRRAVAARGSRVQGQVRVGLIGAGVISHLHLQAMREVPGAQITGVLDVAPGRAAALCPSGVAVFEDAEAFYDAAHPDVVHVLTPPATHCEVAIAAMQRGIHVLCEKPFACTVEEARRMIDAAEANDVRLGVNHNCLFDQRVEHARTLVDQQAIGELRHVEIFWGFDVQRLRQSSASENWLSRLPGGVLEDLAPHPLSIALALLGRDAKLVHHQCFGLAQVAGGGAEELRVCLESPRRSAHIAMSLAVKPDDFSITLYGTHGTVRVDFQDMLVHRRRLMNGPKVVARGAKVAAESVHTLTQLAGNILRLAAHRTSPPADLRPSLRQFYASLQNGSALPADASDGLQVVTMMRMIWPVSE